MGEEFSHPTPQKRDPVVACYIGHSFFALLHFAAKYGDLGVEEALLASTNAGGENVHRGCVLGALVGAAYGYRGIPSHLLDGLVAKGAIRRDIEKFLGAFTGEGRPSMAKAEPAKAEL